MKVLTRTILSFWNSSIGKKILVALTGIVLLLFLPGHMAGNLLVFAGPEALNEYGVWLHELGHGTVIWIARIGLLAAFALHIVLTVQLTARNRAANSEYAYPSTVQASRSSRIMIWSGLTVLAFVIYHLLHFTVRILKDFSGPAYKTIVDGNEVLNIHKMVIAGFSVPLVSLWYIFALSLMCSHLSHGFASVFQTLGVRSAKTQALIRKLGWAYAILIYVGFVSIPVSILFFGYGR